MDHYSDLDLNIYLSRELESYSENITYHDVIIQLHVHSFPSLLDVYEQPWDHRFLKEARIVSDPHGEFTSLQEKVINYLDSPTGKKRMLEQARAIVDVRKKWVKEHTLKDSTYSASIAALAAWTDAAFMYSYFIHNSLSTSQLLPIMRQLEIYNDYQQCRPQSPLEEKDVVHLLQALQSYRQYLDKNSPTQEFVLDPLQDILIERKVQRLIERNDMEAICWLLYSEAFWMYLTTSKGTGFEEHLQSIPVDIKNDLQTLGFVALTNSQIETLCRLSDEIVERTNMNPIRNSVKAIILQDRKIREYIGRNHEFADWDSNVHQIEYMFQCQLKSNGKIKNGVNPDENQVGVEWIEIARLKEYRIYPSIIKQLITQNGDFKGQIYLGDVN